LQHIKKINQENKPDTFFRKKINLTPFLDTFLPFWTGKINLTPFCFAFLDKENKPDTFFIKKINLTPFCCLFVCGLRPSFRERGMARREWNVTGDGQFGRLAKSAGVRTNPHEYAGTGAIRQKKPQPRTVGVSLLVEAAEMLGATRLVLRSPAARWSNPERGFSSAPAPKKLKAHPLRGRPLSFGGGGGNRTRVRKPSATGSTCLAASLI